MPVTVVIRAGAPARGEGSGGIDEPSLTFDGGRIVIGRSGGSDVRLPEPSVSLRHASIRAQGTEYAIIDEGSANGTWVGGVKLGPHTPRLVKSGDLVRVGRVWLEIIVGHKAATPDLGLATRDLALALVRGAMEAMGDDTRAKLIVAQGPDMGAELRLVEDGKEYVIGRGAHCDLPLADEDASREHALVVRRGGHVFLKDLASRNGVHLGDMTLVPERETAWRPPTMARIGASVLALEEPVSLALAELESAADEPLAEADAPPAPVSIAAPPPPPEPPVSQVAPEAPIAEAPKPIPPSPARKKKRVWTAADIGVVTIAVAMIALSLAGLVWVLRP